MTAVRAHALGHDVFSQVRSVLASEAGLTVDDSRRGALDAIVRERMAATGVSTPSEYVDVLRGEALERQSLVEAAVIGETHFWRNPPQIEALHQAVLPSLLRAAAHHRRLRVWSAGCSTGEEPYTLAMLLSDLVPDRSGWDISILGSDVSAKVLQVAARAEYGDRAVALVPSDFTSRFLAGGPGCWRVRQEVVELVELRQHNLVTEPVPFEPGSLDLIVCRNVTIYFDRETRAELMARMRDALRVGGYLVLGHSETLWKVADGFDVVRHGDAFVYRKLSTAEVRAAAQPLPRRVRAAARAALPTQARRSAAEPHQPASRASRPARPGRVAPAPRPEGAEVPVTADDLLVAARAALGEADYERAERLAARVAAAEPMRAEAHYLRALALVDLGRLADALPELRKCVYADPSAGFAHFLLASVLSRLGDPAAAARSYRAAADTLGSRPDHHHAPELGGRDVTELADLCRTLAGDR